MNFIGNHRKMSGFDCAEIGTETRNRLWLRGGFPESYLSPSDKVTVQWRKSFIQTFLNRDIREFTLKINPEKLHRFWRMAAHYHGQTWNSSQIATSLDISRTAARHYLDLLTDALVMRQLQPWLPNIKKRLVKSPKVYLRDSGLFHSLMQMNTMDALQSNPRYGASWEGFALEQIISVLDLDELPYTKKKSKHW